MVDDGALLIAHRLDIEALYGCDGVRAGLVSASAVDVDPDNPFHERAFSLARNGGRSPMKKRRRT